MQKLLGAGFRPVGHALSDQPEGNRSVSVVLMVVSAFSTLPMTLDPAIHRNFQRDRAIRSRVSCCSSNEHLAILAELHFDSSLTKISQ